MSEIYIPLPSRDNINLYLGQNFDGFIIGIDGFSDNFNYLVKPEELEDIISLFKHEKKKLFISLNRLYFNSEIDKVKSFIESIKDLDITGICYTDNGVLNILKEINYKKDIFWVSNHIGTNSKTINFLEKRGVSYALLSSELSKEEIIDIKNKTNIKIGTILYGFLNMATSSRKLISNYFEYIGEKNDKNSYDIKEKVKNEDYKIVENKNTNFFTGKVLNGIKYYPELIKNNIDFIILDDYMLNENNFYNVIEAFSSLRNAYDDKEFAEKIEKVVESNTYYDTFDGFLNKKTVYKVDDYE